MTWMQLYKLFDAECRQGHARIMDVLKKGIKPIHLMDTEEPSKETLLAVDLACQCFADNLKWPKMKPAVAQQCFVRLHAARDFSKFVASPDRPNVDYAESLAKKITNRYSDAELIKWILVDYWWHAGIWADLYQGTIEKD